MSVRHAAVADMFYPGDDADLRRTVDELLADAAPATPEAEPPKVLIAPHAGYAFSGAIAAAAYRRVAAVAGDIDRVVLLGPAHRVYLREIAVPSEDRFATPLGEVHVDRGAVNDLLELPQVVVSSEAHALEHSLEVHLPFLQTVLGDFELIPLVVGDVEAAQVAEVIERLWGDERTLIVVSTDLSHYHPYDDACRIDGATIAAIERFESDLHGEQACGARVLNGLALVARRRGLGIERLGACNSGDTAGPRDRVVGYGAWALHAA